MNPTYWIVSAAGRDVLDRRFSRVTGLTEAHPFTLDEITELIDGSFNSNWTVFFDDWHLVPAVRITTEETMRAFHPVAAYAVDRHNELVEEAKKAEERKKAIKRPVKV